MRLRLVMRLGWHKHGNGTDGSKLLGFGFVLLKRTNGMDLVMGRE
jgi:hypothetical protein